MMKKNKWMIILASLVTISPMFVGLILWNRLPDEIATHFDSANVANGWSSKPVAVFGIPLFLLAMHLLCIGVTMNDPRRKNISEKMFQFIIWIVPAASLICCLSSYAIALGIEVNIGMIVNIMVGIVFMILGNYMHKVKQNYTVGIKIPWTLDSEENWNRTHRLASWLWILSGVVFLINGVLQLGWLLVAILMVSVLVPIVYSFVLYKKGI